MNLDQWHDIHDAYVTFFGDEHRPAAVAFADREGRGPEDILWCPGSVIPLNPGGRIEYLAPSTNYVQVMGHTLVDYKRETTRALLYGEK